MTLYSALVAPFIEYGFMRRALVASIALGLGSGPVGVLLMLRRMSLVGDAMSHAVLPGAAIGFLIAGGVSLPAMGLGGLVAGLSVALLSGLVSRTTPLREDASFASFYLASLALGVLIVSLRGSNMDLLHVLFGTILAIDATALYLVGSIASLNSRHSCGGLSTARRRVFRSGLLAGRGWARAALSLPLPFPCRD